MGIEPTTFGILTLITVIKAMHACTMHGILMALACMHF
jgi:hypothetical protein